MAEVICPQCKASNRGTAQFCAECGTPLLQSLEKSESAPAPKTKPQILKEEKIEPEPAKWVLQNRYQMGESLGQGGFGSVYRAWDINLNRACAIKENRATSSEAQRQFMREATVLANLSHPNLPRVIDHFIIPDQGQYLVMDFVEGQDLEQILEQREIVPVKEALDWVIQVAQALDYLHRQQPPVFHRDIKPANIRITPKGRAMLVDFGLVKVFDPHIHTTVGARAITPGYAPPEQYGRGGTDARTDIYGLGATLYALVTGHEPIESVHRMAGEHLPSAHAVNPAVPLALSDAIERAMALDPAARFQSASEFLTALQAGKEALEKAGAGGEKMTVVVSPELDQDRVTSSAAFQQAQAVSAPVMPTEKMDIGFPVPATTAVEGALPGEALQAEKPPAARKKWLLIGLGGIGLVLICVALVGGGLFALFSGDDLSAVDKTLTARAGLAGPVQQTLTARAQQLGTSETKEPVKETSTPDLDATQQSNQNATSTVLHSTESVQTKTAAAAEAQKSATANSSGQATQNAVKAELAEADAKAKVLYGPKSGALVHEKDDGFIERQTASVGIRNFIAEVTFLVPYQATSSMDWDFGMLLRDGGVNTEFRLYLTSDQSYEITSTTGDPNGKTLAEGKLSGMKTQPGEANKIRVYFIEDRGWFFFNDVFITEFDASQHYSGDVMIGIGMGGSDYETTGKLTEYKDFTVWSIQN